MYWCAWIYANVVVAHCCSAAVRHSTPKFIYTEWKFVGVAYCAITIKTKLEYCATLAATVCVCMTLRGVDDCSGVGAIREPCIHIRTTSANMVVRENRHRNFRTDEDSAMNGACIEARNNSESCLLARRSNNTLVSKVMATAFCCSANCHSERKKYDADKRRAVDIDKSESIESTEQCTCLLQKNWFFSSSNNQTILSQTRKELSK